MKKLGTYKGFKLYQANEKERKDYGRYEENTVLIFRPEDEYPGVTYEDWEAGSMKEAHDWIDSDIRDNAKGRKRR